MDQLISTDTPKTGRASLIQPLGSRDFVALWGGQTFSQFGDSILWVALPLTVYSIGKSTVQMGFVMALLMLPQVILLPFVGILVDRVSRSKLMMFTDIIRCLLVTGLAVLAGTHRLTMPFLYAFVFFFGGMDALFQPAYSAARAQVFTPDIRNAAVGLTQVTGQSARLLGPAIGGLVIGLFTVSAGFAIDAVTLAISVTSLTFLRLKSPNRSASEHIKGLRNFLYELSGGFTELRQRQWLWVTIVAFAVVNVCGTGIISILLPWLIKVHLGLSATTFGLVSSASGIGAILSAVIYGRRQRWRRRGWIAYGGIAMSAIAAIFLVIAHAPLALMAITAASGAGIMLFGLTWESSLQELVPEASFGRVASLDMFGSFALLPIGNIVTGWLATAIGGIHTILIESIVVLIVIAGALAAPGVRNFD